MLAENEKTDASDARPRAVLLVVDDETAVCRAVARVMRRHFDDVVTAGNAQEAEAVLSTRAVTHLICDHWFGKGQPLGIDLVKVWVEKYASLERVLLLTGVDIALLVPPAPIVRIIPKTIDAADLQRELGIC